MGRKKQDTYEALGALIRANRQGLKMSVKDVCKKIGRDADIHKVYAIEVGEYKARLHFLIEVILAVDTTEDQLRAIGFKEKFENVPGAREILKPLLDVL